jgi:hypothetical protein
MPCAQFLPGEGTRYRHPAGPRYDRVEHRVHNICRSLYAENPIKGMAAGKRNMKKREIEVKSGSTVYAQTVALSTFKTVSAFKTC